MELTMFEKLQELPLLQGMSTKDIEDFVFKVQLDFQKHTIGDLVAAQGELCRKVIFILGGTLSIQYRDPEDNIVVTEEVKAPYAIEPFSMFGMTQRYTRSYTFESDGSTLTIPKQVFLNTLMDWPIIRTNMLNMVCYKMQQSTSKLMQPEPEDVRTKVTNFLRNFCIHPRGRKEYKMKIVTLAEMICETRLNVSKALKELSDEGIITQHRLGFIVKDIQQLPK